MFPGYLQNFSMKPSFARPCGSLYILGLLPTVPKTIVGYLEHASCNFENLSSIEFVSFFQIIPPNIN